SLFLTLILLIMPAYSTNKMLLSQMKCRALLVQRAALFTRLKPIQVQVLVDELEDHFPLYLLYEPIAHLELLGDLPEGYLRLPIESVGSDEDLPLLGLPLGEVDSECTVLLQPEKEGPF